MKTIEIKDVFDRVIYSHTQEENSIKITLEKAVREYANLKNANLENAILYGANLENANLENANLKNAYLENASLKNASLPIYCKWLVSFINNGEIIKIGCKEKSIEDWDDWFENSTEKFDTERGTEDFKRIYANYVAVREYVKIMFDK